MPRILVFTSPHDITGQQSPGVAVLKRHDMTVAVWSNRASHALSAVARAVGGGTFAPPLINARPPRFTEFAESIVNGLEMPASWYRGRVYRLDADMSKPASLWTPPQVAIEAAQCPLEQVYFAVGGPIAGKVSDKKTTGYVIL